MTTRAAPSPPPACSPCREHGRRQRRSEHRRCRAVRRIHGRPHQLATAFGTHDPRLPVSELTGFAYDRVLGITTRFTKLPLLDHVGAGACCTGRSSSPRDFDDRLMGKCCDQKPCRKGAPGEDLGDGQKIVYYADVNYDGVVGQLPEGTSSLPLPRADFDEPPPHVHVPRELGRPVPAHLRRRQAGLPNEAQLRRRDRR